MLEYCMSKLLEVHGSKALEALRLMAEPHDAQIIG